LIRIFAVLNVGVCGCVPELDTNLDLWIQMDFSIVLSSSILFSTDSCEFLSINQYILLSLSVCVSYMFFSVKLLVEVHAEIFGVFGLWNLSSIRQ